MNWFLISLTLKTWVNIYIIILHSNKQNQFLLVLLQYEIFYVDSKAHIEMNRFKTIATWIPLVP
jgi:hypothetical protein